MRILLADGESARAKLHLDACVGRGYLVDRAEHGAGALEQALEAPPDLVICPIDLPVIDGERLAAILRGNPRTQHASFIFLVQDELDAPMSMDPRDGTVVSPWHSEEVLDHIDAFLERQTRFGTERSNTEIEGKLTQISLVDLLQIFAMNRRSGTLRIWRSGRGGSGSVAVRSGQVLDASVPLADGSCLVGEKALYRLLTWKEGRFEFVPGPVPEVGRIDRPSRALLLEGVRQVDEWFKLRPSLPGDDARLTLSLAREQIPGRDQPLISEVVDAVEAYRRVGEVVDHCPFPDYQVLRALQALIQRGALVHETLGGGGAGGSSSEGIFNTTQLRRMREWAAGQRPRLGSVVKLLVAGASAGQIRGVHQVLRECPDFMTETRLAREPQRVGGLGSLGHFSLGEALSLRVVAVPCAASYAPLWDVAAHGMMAAIVVPRGPYGPALVETERVFTRLRELRPHAVAHLFLADDAAGVLSKDARSEVEQLEGGALFVLPAAPSPERLVVLRNLFAKLVP